MGYSLVKRGITTKFTQKHLVLVRRQIFVRAMIDHVICVRMFCSLNTFFSVSPMMLQVHSNKDTTI